MEFGTMTTDGPPSFKTANKKFLHLIYSYSSNLVKFIVYQTTGRAYRTEPPTVPLW